MGHRALRGVIAGLAFFVTLYARPSADAASPVIDWEWDQIRPAVAHNPENDTYLVVWEDHHWGLGDDWDIYGRLVAADGTPLGSAFAIGFADAKHRLALTVAYNPQVDEFLVAYEYEYSDADHDLYARRVSAAGAVVGDEIALVTPGDLDSLPALAYNPAADEYMLVWQRRVGLEAPYQWDVIGIRVSASVTTIGGGIPVAVGTTSQSLPALGPGIKPTQHLSASQPPRPVTAPTAIEELREHSVDVSHGTAEQSSLVVKQQMVVRAHQTRRVTPHPPPLAGIPDQAYERLRVFVIDEDCPALNAPVHHMLPEIGLLDAQWPCHSGKRSSPHILTQNPT